MFKKTRFVVAALPLAAVLALAGCGSPQEQQSPASSTPASSSTANAADEMFAVMMIPHHEQAVEMSDMLLAKPDADPAVAELAQQVKDAQAPEIALMRGWLEDWGAEEAYDMGGMHHGDGMMSEDDMAALEAADGTEASRLYLEQMILHHEGAIDMAQAQLADGQDAEALVLAQTIVDTQSAEIAEMKRLLAQL